MKPITIVCVGQPNVGKSSLVNKICGSHLKVGNFTGVTIEKAEAFFTHKGHQLRIIDLPGTYSLNDYSFEERITKQFLENEEYDVVLNVVDSTNLERCLFLSAQLLELNTRMCLALNMSDEVRKENLSIDEKVLSETLGVECISVSAFYGENIEALLDSLVKLALQTPKTSKRVYSEDIEKQICNLCTFLTQNQYAEIAQLMQSEAYSLRDVAVRLLAQDKKIDQALQKEPCFVELSAYVQQCAKELCKQSGESVSDVFNNDILSFVKEASIKALTQQDKPKSLTQKIDSVLLNKYLGIPIFLLLMWCLFQITFYLGEFPKKLIEDGADSLGEWVEGVLPYEFLASLLSGGIIAGVGAVLSFLPHILILFFGIVLLESTGYMARIAFLLDGFFHKFGLHGKSFIPLVSGFGCSVPAYMSTRMLKNRNDRMITLFIINFMSCGARLPVYTLFIGSFFAPNIAGNVLYGIYIVGALVGLVMAKILKLTAFRGDDEPFVMEIPKYRLPSIQLITFSVWRRAVSYVKKAGTFILAASIIIWVGTQFPKNEQLQREFSESMQVLEQHIEQLRASGASDDSVIELENRLVEKEHKLQVQLVEQSYLGRIGRFIQPIFAPMDFDWRISVSLLNGLLAKETIVSSMGVLYALGTDVDEDNDKPLRDVLRDYVSLPSAIAFILFIMFYNPCFAATIVFGKEAGGKIFIAYLFIFTSVVSYIFALLGYKLATFLF